MKTSWNCRLFLQYWPQVHLPLVGTIFRYHWSTKRNTINSWGTINRAGLYACMPILKWNIFAHFSLAFFSYLSMESFFLNVLSALLLCRIVCTQKFRFALRTFIPTWKEKRRKLIWLFPFVFRKTVHRSNIYLWVFGVRVFMTPPRYMQLAYIKMTLHYRLSHNLVT